MTGEEIKEQVYDAVACDDMFYRPELCDAIYDMVDENEKLRELVREAVDAASFKDMRDWRYGKRLAFLREARELGIEEDE